MKELSTTLEKNEEKYSEDFRLTQEKLIAINEKVVETRQIIGGASAPSKVKHFSMIFSKYSRNYFILLTI